MNIKLVAVCLGLSLTGGAATAQTVNCMGSGPVRTCVDDDGNVAQSFRSHDGSVTTFSDGDIYQTRRTGRGQSTTTGSDGSVYNTQRFGGMATTMDDDGNVYRTHRFGNAVVTTDEDGNTITARRFGNNIVIERDSPAVHKPAPAPQSNWVAMPGADGRTYLCTVIDENVICR